jgi:hypothetical protein
MPTLVWDKVGSRTYENGLDRGVIYLPDGSAVVWNGMTSVVEQFDRAVVPIHYDGMKINDFVILGSFKATAKAVSYPKGLFLSEGISEVRNGFALTDQKSKIFGFCYRTRVGNDLEGSDAAYKIHIVYNVTAIPSDKDFQTVGGDPSIVEFEWTLTAVPAEVKGFYPTAHIIIDSSELDPWLLEEIEDIIYGDSDADAALLPIDELVDLVSEWFRIKIIDNGDGTWTAIEQRPGSIKFLPGDEFRIDGANAVYLDEYTFIISDTKDLTDIPQIKIINNNNGTWNAETDQDNLIMIEDVEDYFEIYNANARFIDEDTYQIEDTLA